MSGQQSTPQVNPPRFRQADIAGTYAYRFSGFSTTILTPFKLAGLGQFLITDSGGLTGSQRTSIMALKGQGASLLSGGYSLNGTITLQPDGTGTATIRFNKTCGNGVDVIDGEFFVHVGGTPDRLWLLSSLLSQNSSAEANELVEVEAVRLVSQWDS